MIIIIISCHYHESTKWLLPKIINSIQIPLRIQSPKIQPQPSDVDLKNDNIDDSIMALRWQKNDVTVTSVMVISLLKVYRPHQQ